MCDFCEVGITHVPDKKHDDFIEDVKKTTEMIRAFNEEQKEKNQKMAKKLEGELEDYEWQKFNEEMDTKEKLLREAMTMEEFEELFAAAVKLIASVDGHKSIKVLAAFKTFIYKFKGWHK
jgi:hypothetical protein